MTAKDVLETMAARASIAFLVHTAEDEQEDGQIRARQNVVHETGLFQGRLGFKRALVVREDGCEDFSNLHGLQEIRYQKGQLPGSFHEVLSVIKREFPQAF
jgi:predicted nucleotide-binding protein